MFTIYPAIDMRGGKCVRLIQGDYSQETVYGHSPVEMARSFVSQGATWIHMVDLDGAKEGRRVNDTFVVEVAKTLGVNVQIGGGIRTEEDVAYYLERGVARVILGSAAISNPPFVKAMLRTYGERIVIGIDAKMGLLRQKDGRIHQQSMLLSLANSLRKLGRKRLFLLILRQMACYQDQISTRSFG